MSLTRQVASAAKAISAANHHDTLGRALDHAREASGQSAAKGFARLAWDRPSLEAMNSTGDYVLAFRANLSHGTVPEASQVRENTLSCIRASEASQRHVHSEKHFMPTKRTMDPELRIRSRSTLPPAHPGRSSSPAVLREATLAGVHQLRTLCPLPDLLCASSGLLPSRTF